MKKFLTITLGLFIVALLGSRFIRSLTPKEKIQAAGNLIFTFNGLPPDAPVFSIDDLKPGDCYLRPVTVQNNNGYAVPVAVKSAAIQNLNNLGSVLFLAIAENASQIYGVKTLNQFFIESTATLEGLPLSVVPANSQTQYLFKVCMPKEAGNEWQRTLLVFDLLFGRSGLDITPTPSPTPSLPPECADLAGLIQRVYYVPDTGGYFHASIYNDLIYGSAVADEIDASGGHDCIIAGDGDDYVRSEDGNDIIIGGNGNDTLRSGSGNDFVSGGPGDDVIDGGTGADYLDGGDGHDVINAGNQDDQVYGGPGNDKLSGSTGNDYLHGGADTDSLSGGSGTDTCLVGETLSSCEL